MKIEIAEFYQKLFSHFCYWHSRIRKQQ